MSYAQTSTRKWCNFKSCSSLCMRIWFMVILWYIKISANSTTKHETSSVVEKMGKKCCWYSAGDFVIASFTHGRGQCSICLARFDGNHLNEGHFINSVYQSDYLNFHYANWILLKISRKRPYYNYVSHETRIDYHASIKR